MDRKRKQRENVAVSVDSDMCVGEIKLELGVVEDDSRH